MAAAPPPDPRLLLALLLLPPLLPLPAPPPPLCAAAGPELGRRFAERKRCADPECSMLMCRGKAMKDFKGPDCRFVNFKKGEAVYVYYKLIGKSTELWAGSVGSDFGYFPKDLLEVNHNYTNEELELPTDETDFVCFDGGRDDFDNYNVDELLKSSKETIANERETESSDPRTKPAEGTEREEEVEKVHTVQSLDALEADNVELSTEKDEEALTMTEELDSFLIEGSEGTKVDSSDSSHEENSQGDQTAHEHLQGTLNDRLKGLESENTKNTSIAQGETSQLDKESEEVDAYTLLDRELSVNLKTKFGSTADAVVSDDEVTRLVTSLEDDFNEDLSINAHDSEKESDFADPSEEVPLLSFMAEEGSISLGDSDADENNGLESKNHELDENEGAMELNNQRDDEEERDSDALIKDAFTKSEKSGDSINVDRFESEQTKKKQDEVMLISKREAPAAQLEDLSRELLRHEPIGARDPGSEEKANKTEEFEEQLMADEMASHTNELQSTTVPDPHALPSPRDGLKTKSFVESKQDALGLPAGDVNKSPESVPLAEIEKDEKKFEDDTLEEISESDLKHKKLWEKMKEKGRDQYKSSADVPAKPVEEVQNGSQSDTGDTKLLKDKPEHGMPAVEKEILRHEEDSKQRGEADHENRKLTSFKEEPEIKGGNVKETPAGEGDPSHRGAAEQPMQWENETEYSEADVKEELSGNLGKMTEFEKSIEKSSPEEKSRSTTQNTNRANFTQQGTAHTEDEDSNKNLGTNLAREKNLRPELQPKETDAEDEADLKQMEEELLEDENAASAKLLHARVANVQGNTLDVEGRNPELKVPNEAFSGTADPTYETGEETNSFSEEAEKITNMQDEHETGNKEFDVPASEDAKLDEMEHIAEDDEESSEAEDLLAVEEYNFKSSDMEDSNDFHQRKDHLPEDVSQRDSKEMQNIEDTGNDHQQSAHFPSPADISAATNDTVTEYSESVKRLTIIRDFLDEKCVIRLQKYLGLQHVVRIEAMFYDMKVEMELARKASNNNEDIEKALDQILEFSESNIMDVVGKVLDSRVAENKEEVVKEMDLYDEESALMDDIQELIYSLRSKYSSASESVPLASFIEQEDDQLNAQDTAKEAEYDTDAVRNPDAIDESYQKFQQLEDKRPVQPIEEEEERSVNVPPELEEASFSDNREAKEAYNSERRLPLADTSFGSTDSEESASEDIAAGIPVRTAGNAGKQRVSQTAAPHGDGDGGGASGAALGGAAAAARRLLLQLVATLPEDIRPGPDFHGLPWEPVITTALVGIATLAIIFWRTCLSVKSRIYQVTEKQLAEKIKNLLQEKTEILDKMSEYDQKIKQAKESVKAAQEQKNILSDETAGLKDTVKGLEEANRKLDDKIKSLHSMLETERKQNEKKQKKISESQKSLEKLEEAISVHSAELSEVQIALNEAKLNEEKVKSELQHVQEENARLKKSKEQLLKEAEGWSERHTELSEQIKLYQKSQKDIEEALAYKENEIEVLTNCIMQLKQLDIDPASEAKKDGEGHEWSRGDDLANGELPDNENEKMKTQIKQMMDVSRVKTMLSIVEEDRNLLQSKLSDEVTARHELEEQIKKLEHDSCSLQSAKARLENECKTLQQKVEILGELYQQKEMALQKKLTQEEYERQEKEQKLSAADEKAVLAIEEVKVYKQRIQDMEEELQKTERSYKNQIAAHEKKAHDNWLIARSAERALAEEKREAANLRQKLIEVNQKIVMLQRPLIVKPTPGRPDRQVPPRRGPLSRDGSFGPSPVSGGNPSPTQMIEVPGRPLSAPRREGSRGEFGTVVDGPSVPRRPPEIPGRMSVPDLGPAVASLISSGPRTSSPSTAMDRAQPSPKESEAPCVTTDSPSSVEPPTANVSPKGPPSFPGTPIMTSPVMGPPPPPPVRYGPPPAPLRGHFGPRPLPVPLVRGAPLPPPAARDFLPGPPLGMRDLPPGPLPPPPDPRAYGRGHPSFRPLGPPGPRDYPQGPRLPPPGSRDYTPSPSRDLPPSGPRDYPAGPPPPPAGSKDYTQPPAQKP
ncbi:transport and Golgi organization protein 1 homolog isoform X1 [Cygnus atratus]|uniref:transport and Golgi organization protein 1 homolog isoform X1 n=1 Tax=Cygnus atratus TaxID=8868 RepID=UPI0021B84A9A|nr:transport and Golgi organization protein 1 homolog isoform X1 [Cygnus atratus]